jgi:hypothetical protein
MSPLSSYDTLYTTRARRRPGLGLSNFGEEPWSPRVPWLGAFLFKTGLVYFYLIIDTGKSPSLSLQLQSSSSSPSSLGVECGETWGSVYHLQTGHLRHADAL